MNHGTNKKAFLTVAVFLTSLLVSLSPESSFAEPEWKARREISATVQKFYAQYLSATKAPKVRTSILRANLTPEFYLSIQDAFEELDADPLIRSEYIGIDYRKKIHVYNIDVRPDGTARADVKLGEIPQGVKSPNGPVKLRLKLERSNSNWKIASVERGFDN